MIYSPSCINFLCITKRSSLALCASFASRSRFVRCTTSSPGNPASGSLHPQHHRRYHHRGRARASNTISMCIMRSYETRGRGVVDPPPRRGNYTSHPPAGVMRLPREWRRTSVESFSDDGRYVEYRFVATSMAASVYIMLTSSRRSRSRPRAIEYVEEPRIRARSRARSVSRRRVSDVEIVRPARTSYIDPRGSGYVDERVTRRSVSRVRH